MLVEEAVETKRIVPAVVEADTTTQAESMAVLAVAVEDTTSTPLQAHPTKSGNTASTPLVPARAVVATPLEKATEPAEAPHEPHLAVDLLAPAPTVPPTHPLHPTQCAPKTRPNTKSKAAHAPTPNHSNINPSVNSTQTQANSVRIGTQATTAAARTTHRVEATTPLHLDPQVIALVIIATNKAPVCPLRPHIAITEAVVFPRISSKSMIIF